MTQKSETILDRIVADKRDELAAAQKSVPETMKSLMFLAATLMLFLLLTRPLSRHRKPACIMKTSIAARVIQSVSMV